MSVFSRATLSIFIFTLLITQAYAEIKTIEADSTYRMGYNDSKVDARRIAVQEAKRKALELAGTFVASLTQVKEYKLTKDEVTAYTAGVVGTEIASEETRGTTDHPELFVKIRCTVDTDVMVRQIDRYRENQELGEQLEASSKEKESLRRERDELQKQLAAEKDKTRAEETRGKMGTVLSREESIDDTNRAWSRLAPQMNVYTGNEENQGVKLGDLEDSALMLEKVVAADPANQQARILLSSVYQQKNDPARAEATVRAALERQPNNPLLHMRLGIILREQGNPADALKEFRIIEKKRPNQPYMLFQAGLAHKAGRNCRMAVGYMRRFLMYTKRLDNPDLEKLKPKAVAVIKACGDPPPEKQTKRKKRRRRNESSEE